MKTSELKSFIYGTMLGDSSVSFSNYNTISCGQIKEDLILYKLKVYKDHFANLKTNYIIEDYKAPDQVRQPLHRIYATHPYFNKIRNIFYDSNNKKRVTKKILKKLKPNGLAIWFADDGTTTLIGINNYLSGKKDRLTDRRVEMCTDGFLLEDVKIIQSYFKELVGYDVRIINRDHTDKLNKNPTGYRIRFSTLGGQVFLSIIYKEFLNYPSLLYKMDMGYRDNLLTSEYVLQEYCNLYKEIKTHRSFLDRLER